MYSNVTDDYWAYQFDVKESSADSWTTGTKYTITVWGDGLHLGTLYVVNDSADPVKKEGVQVRVELGSAFVPDNISIKIEKTA